MPLSVETLRKLFEVTSIVYVVKKVPGILPGAFLIKFYYFIELLFSFY